MRKFLLFTFISVIASGCGSKVIFDETNNMSSNVWGRFDDQNFNVSVKKDESYDLYFTLKYSSKIPNSHVIVTISMETPIGEFRTREYIFDLKDKDDSWIGTNKGDYRYIELPVKKDFTFKETGTCKINIENKYPKAKLPGIGSVGFKVKLSQ